MVAEAKPSKSICLNWLHVHVSNVNCLAREAKGEFVLVHASMHHAYLLIVCIVCNFTSVYNMKVIEVGIYMSTFTAAIYA